MEDLLIEVLGNDSYPVYVQGALYREYPNDFFTYWENTGEEKYYNNVVKMIIFDYDVNFYSTDPEKVYAEIRKMVKALRKNGFVVVGEGHTVASDEPTHMGRGINVKYIKNMEEK